MNAAVIAPIASLAMLPHVDSIRDIRRKAFNGQLTTGDHAALDDLLAIPEDLAQNAAQDIPASEQLGGGERAPAGLSSAPELATDEIGPRCSSCHLERGDSEFEDAADMCFGCIAIAGELAEGDRQYAEMKDNGSLADFRP